MGVRHRHRPSRPSQVSSRRHPTFLRQRPTAPGAISPLRVLVSWLRELVEVPVSIEELAEALTLRGFEVGAIEPQTPNEDGSLDAVLDLEITTNRPDCLSVIGIAREVSTLYATDLRPPPSFSLPGTDSPPLLTITVDDPHLCPRYVGAVASVSVGSSPPWP